MPKNAPGARPNGASRRKGFSVAARNAVARARGVRSGGWVRIVLAGIVVLIAIVVIAKSVRSQQNQVSSIPEK